MLCYVHMYTDCLRIKMISSHSDFMANKLFSVPWDATWDDLIAKITHVCNPLHMHMGVIIVS